MNTDFSILIDNLALFIPIIALQFILALTALIHVLRHKNYKVGNRALWVVLVLFVQIIGPVLYFIIGRG